MEDGTLLSRFPGILAPARAEPVPQWISKAPVYDRSAHDCSGPTGPGTGISFTTAFTTRVAICRSLAVPGYMNTPAVTLMVATPRRSSEPPMFADGGPYTSMRVIRARRFGFGKFGNSVLLIVVRWAAPTTRSGPAVGNPASAPVSTP